MVSDNALLLKGYCFEPSIGVHTNNGFWFYAHDTIPVVDNEFHEWQCTIQNLVCQDIDDENLR